MTRPVPLPSLTLFNAFREAARGGSFAAGATALDMSPSAVSKSIKALEEQWNVQLFRRTGRASALTPHGAMLLEYVERAMTELDEAQRRLSVLKGDVFGRLRLSAPVAYAHRVVAPHLPAFERANPEVRVELVASNRFANLLEGQVDASIRVARRLADSRLRARRIGEHRLWTVAASSIGNWLPDDFDDERLRTLPGACFRLGLTGEVEPWRFRIGTVERELLPERRTIMDDNASMVAWAVAMGGVTQVPSYAAADDVAAGRLMRIWPDREQSAASVYIVYPEHNRDNPALKAFVQFFKTVLVSSAA